MSEIPADVIPPDVKDWTFVVSEGCPECGFDPALVSRPQLAGRLRATTARWAAVLARADAGVRPSALVWSPLEYGCHVRDVSRVFGHRVRLMLSVPDAEFANWDQDEAAVEGRYGEQVAAAVTEDLTQATLVAAELFDALAGEQWQRRGLRSNGSTFTVETIGVYFMHDLEHHLHDVAG